MKGSKQRRILAALVCAGIMSGAYAPVTYAAAEVYADGTSATAAGILTFGSGGAAISQIKIAGVQFDAVTGISDVIAINTGASTAASTISGITLTNGAINTGASTAASTISGITLTNGAINTGASTAASTISGITLTNGAIDTGLSTSASKISGITLTNGALGSVSSIDGAAVVTYGTGGLTIGTGTSAVNIGGGTNILSNSTGTFNVTNAGDTTVKSLTISGTSDGISATGVVTGANGSTLGNAVFSGNNIDNSNTANGLVVEGVTLKDGTVNAGATSVASLAIGSTGSGFDSSGNLTVGTTLTVDATTGNVTGGTYNDVTIGTTGISGMSAIDTGTSTAVSTISGITLTDGALGNVTSIDGATVAAGVTGGLAVEGVTLNAGTISNGAGNFNVDAAGIVTVGTTGTLSTIDKGSATFTTVAGTTTIDGNTITTGTLTTDNLVISSTDGTLINLNSDGSASLASGKFLVSPEGYVTNQFAGTGGDVSFTTGLTGTAASFTNTAGDVASSTVGDNKVSNSVMNGTNGSATTNTLTSATTSVVNGTDSVVNLTTATANTQTVASTVGTNTTTDTATSHINTITDGSLTSTITADVNGLSVKGSNNYGMNVNTTTGITTFDSANNTANVTGGATQTTIDGNTITTGTLTTDELVINSADGSFISLSADGSASLASGKFLVSPEGYVTNQFAGTGGDVSFTTGLTGTAASFTNTAGDVASSTVGDNKVSNSVMNGTNGSATTNTLTSATTSVVNGTDSVVNLTTATANTQTVASTVGTNTTTDTATSSKNVVVSTAGTNTVENTAMGTVFTNSNNNTSINGGLALTTTISGNTITTGQITADSLVITGTSTNSTSGANTGGTLVLSGDGSLSSKVQDGSGNETTFVSDIDNVLSSVTNGTTIGENLVTADVVSSGVWTSNTTNSGRVITASNITDTVMDGDNQTTVSTNATGLITEIKDGTNTSTSTSTATATSNTFNNGTDTTTIATDHTGMTITNSASATNQTIVSSTDVSITDPDDSTSRIRLSDVGQISTMDSELLNSNNGSEARDTVMSGLNNEAMIRRREVKRLDGRINGVGASAAALSGLHPLEYDPDNKFSIAAAYGGYNGSNAAALGAFYRPNENVMINFGASMGSGENLFTVGVAFALDKNPNYGKSTKRAMLQNIKTLQMENGKIANDMGSIQMKNKELAKQNAVLNARLDAIEKMLAKNN